MSRINKSRTIFRILIAIFSFVPVFIIAASEEVTFSASELPSGPVGSYLKPTTSFGNLIIKSTDSNTSTAFDSLVLLNSPAGLYDADTSIGVNITNGIGISDGNIFATEGTWFTFATANGGKFDLVSIDLTEGLSVFTDIEVLGYRDDSIIASQVFIILPGTINQSITFPTTFDNVDEIRIRQKTTGYFDSGVIGQDWLFYENFVIQTIEDFDNDGIADSIDPDDDNDGLPDIWEIANGLNPFDSSDASLDEDGDGLTNLQEFIAGTDPNLADTDGDGMTDSFEIDNGYDPIDGSDCPDWMCGSSKIWLYKYQQSTP